MASDAESWLTSSPRTPLITPARKEQLLELAFLNACLAWEVFLEQTFILYANGNKSPAHPKPVRYIVPPDLSRARAWVIPEGKPFESWNDPEKIRAKAERFFKNGEPFSAVMRSNQSLLSDIRILRNGIAHKSSEATLKFENLAHRLLGSVPIGMSVGGLLSSSVRTLTPPTSYLENYLDKLEAAARIIVKT